MDNYREVRDWLISLLDGEAKPFTQEVNRAMQELWKKRESVAGEQKMIVNAFSAVLEYKAVEDHFTPHYFEKQDRLKALWQKVLEQTRILKEYVEK